MNDSNTQTTSVPAHRQLDMFADSLRKAVWVSTYASGFWQPAADVTAPDFSFEECDLHVSCRLVPAWSGDGWVVGWSVILWPRSTTGEHIRGATVGWEVLPGMRLTPAPFYQPEHWISYVSLDIACASGARMVRLVLAGMLPYIDDHYHPRLQRLSDELENYARQILTRE